MSNTTDFKNKSQEQMIEYAVRMRKERDFERERAELAEADFRATKLCLWQLIKGQEEHGTFGPAEWLNAVRAIVLGGDEDEEAELAKAYLRWRRGAEF